MLIVSTPRGALRTLRSALASTAAVLGAGLILLVSAPGASAHTALAESSPADGSTVSSSPAAVVLTYTDTLAPSGAVVRVTGPDGTAAAGDPEISGATVTQALVPSLPDGRYAVRWQVAAEDGHPVTGTLHFTVKGSAASPSPDAPPSPTPDATPTPTGSAVSSEPTSATDEGSTAALWAGGAVAVVAGAGGVLAVVLRRRGQEPPQQ